jgi:hypothetical protein
MTIHALVDGDGFAYRFAAAAEKKTYLVQTGHSQVEEHSSYREAVKAASDGGVIWSRVVKEDMKNVAQSLNSCLSRVTSRTGAGVLHICLAGPEATFRSHTARLRTYKGNRHNEPPALLRELRAYLSSTWGAVLAKSEEVDDILSYMSRELGPDAVVVGYDKDLDQIPGAHYDWVNDKRYNVTDAEARLRLWVQALHGDVVDNIGGCWGIGPSKAQRLVADAIAEGADDGALWRVIVEEYEKSQERPGCPYAEYDPEAVAQENYTLVRLKQTRFEEVPETFKIPLKARRDSSSGPSEKGNQI